ncbi:MAG: hypothetical protein AAF547_19250 [Actinomycetota bacterium]
MEANAMTKRIVSGIFVLTALGALGVILAGALTSGEQLIVRFLTAVIVAALGLYVISDLRLQADDEAGVGRATGTNRVGKVKAPPNSTAAFMATVTRKNEARRQDEAVADAKPQARPEPVVPATEVIPDEIMEPAGSVRNASGTLDTVVAGADQFNPADHTMVGVGAAASSATEAISAGVEGAGSDGPDRLRANARPRSEAPETVRDQLLGTPSVDISDLFVDQGTAGVADAAFTGNVAENAWGDADDNDVPGRMGRTNGHDENDASPATGSGPDAETAGGPGVNNGTGPTDRHDEIDGAGPGDERNGVSNGAEHGSNGSTINGDHGQTNGNGHHRVGPFSGRLSDSPLAADGSDPVERLDGPPVEIFDPTDHLPPTRPAVEAHPRSEVESAPPAAAEFEYSDDLQADDHVWPAPAGTPVPDPGPLEKAASAYEAKRRVEADAATTPLPIPTGGDVEAIDYADAPLAPIIDLREVADPQAEGIDAAINAGEVEVIATLIEQGMLNTEGPITDREVRTMVYVAFTSNELRKLLVAGGSPDGPNYGLDLGPVELFDERLHTPAPKTLYAGVDRPQPTSQLG